MPSAIAKIKISTWTSNYSINVTLCMSAPSTIYHIATLIGNLSYKFFTFRVNFESSIFELRATQRVSFISTRKKWLVHTEVKNDETMSDDVKMIFLCVTDVTDPNNFSYIISWGQFLIFFWISTKFSKIILIYFVFSFLHKHIRSMSTVTERT